MLRAEQRNEFYILCIVQAVDRGDAVGVDAGLIRDEADPLDRKSVV